MFGLKYKSINKMIEYKFEKSYKSFNTTYSLLIVKYKLNDSVDIIVERNRYYIYRGSIPDVLNRYQVEFRSHGDKDWGRNNNFKCTMNERFTFCNIKEVNGYIMSTLRRNKLFTKGVDKIVFPEDF